MAPTMSLTASSQSGDPGDLAGPRGRQKDPNSDGFSSGGGREEESQFWFDGGVLYPSRGLTAFAQSKESPGIYFCGDSASIFSITIALEPPRSKTFPVTMTLSAAKGRSLGFCPLEGVVAAMGQ